MFTNCNQYYERFHWTPVGITLVNALGLLLQQVPSSSNCANGKLTCLYTSFTRLANRRTRPLTGTIGTCVEKNFVKIVCNSEDFLRDIHFVNDFFFTQVSVVPVHIHTIVEKSHIFSYCTVFKHGL